MHAGYSIYDRNMLPTFRLDVIVHADMQIEYALMQVAYEHMQHAWDRMQYACDRVQRVDAGKQS